MDYILSPHEWAIAKYIGEVRQREAETSGLRDQHGLEMGGRNPLDCHIMGAAGEIACANVLNIYWRPSVNTFKAPDLLDNLQVRTRGRHDYDLLVRPRDSSSDLFVLVTTSGDRLFRVHGYISGRAAKQDKYKQSHGGRAPAYFVPQSDLWPLDDLIEVIANTRAVRIGILPACGRGDTDDRQIRSLQ